ncbi:hypothetical protein FOA52_009718 [Chlamydomonas sp. UWO 241]|nr:hypothetical protein FOA52_009718 [Chlamydomonas sp. UWO 241]
MDFSAEVLTTLSAAPLLRLKKLEVEFKGTDAGGWSVPVLSSTASAGPRELQLTNEYSRLEVFISFPEALLGLHNKLSIDAVEGFSQLRTLKIDTFTVTDLTPLAGCPQLRELSIPRNGSLASLALLGCCAQLEVLNVTKCHQLSSLEGLEACSQLKRLDMYDCTALRTIAPLSACSQLKNLNIGQCELVSNLAPLSACVRLERLIMWGTSMSSLEPLSACRLLKRLNIRWCAHVISLTPLAACGQLRAVYVEGCDELTSVEPLQACAQLEELGSSRRGGVWVLSGVEALKAALPRLRTTCNGEPVM